MESIDRLLAELKAEYQASQKNAELNKSQPSVQTQVPLPSVEIPSNQTLEKSHLNLYPSVLDRDLAQIKAEYEAQNKAQEVTSPKALKVEDAAPNKAQEVTSLATQPPEKIVQSELDVQTHRQKVRQAQVWLKKLDKNSDERYWFDQFAFKYSSRIDAAIDYLQAVNEFD